MENKKNLSEELRCELCGEYFQNLATHITKIHGMDPETYKEQFGVSHVMSATSATQPALYGAAARLFGS